MASRLACDADSPPRRTAPVARLGQLAVDCLMIEASLTPKPGLVDGRGAGAHADLDLSLMHRSAQALLPCFSAMADRAIGQSPSQALRETLAAVGRDGERAMFAATGGINTHKGAIWALGLLVAASAIHGPPGDPLAIAALAGRIARYPDALMPPAATNGSRVAARYGVAGARGQAQDDFPHVTGLGLPALHAARCRGAGEDCAMLDALLAIMAELDDTCLLHRGGAAALAAARHGAAHALRLGGAATAAGLAALQRLDAELLDLNASPGGSGDLLAATLFLDRLSRSPPATTAAFDRTGDRLPWKYSHSNFPPA